MVVEKARFVAHLVLLWRGSSPDERGARRVDRALTATAAGEMRRYRCRAAGFCR
jgi:hypothetical protein